MILLRGAVDGLSIVVPYAEEAYHRQRPTIAIAPPGKTNGALPLDGRFGLHPALSSLMPLWREGRLAFVHAAGSSDPTRSHFDAQLYIETGAPGQNRIMDGWMNRLLAALPGLRSPADAIAIGPTLPRILSGRMPAAIKLPRRRPTAALDRPDIASAFDRLYAADDALGAAYRAGRVARTQLLADLAAEQKIADDGAPPPTGFAARAARLARLVATTRASASPLWRSAAGTPMSSRAPARPARRSAAPLGEGLAVLARGLGGAWHDTVIVVLSEFGRTVHENGNGGTDHGHGNVIWVVGGAVNGGRVLGDWPGLSPAQLYQRRDLAVTTDYRSVLAQVAERHLRLTDRQLSQLFPAMPQRGPSFRVMRA